jgi:hypothetical protein
LERGADDVTAIAAVGTGQRAQVGEEPRAFLTVRQRSLFLVDEGDERIARDAVGLSGPVAPAVGGLDGGAKALAFELRLRLAELLQIVQELEEQNSGEHRQPVEVRGETLVLAHDVAAGLDETPKRLGGGREGVGSLLCACHGCQAASV